MTRALDFDTDAITVSEALIYRTFLRHVEGHPKGTEPLLYAVLKTRDECGVGRARVMEVIRKLNPEYTPMKKEHHIA